MRLSADRINSKSPYWVIQLDEMTFRFVTRNGIIYRVGFYQDQYFLGNRAYHFFIDHAAEPMQQSAIVARQLLQYLQGLVSGFQQQSQQSQQGV